MRTRSIGSLAVSEIGLGCNNFGMKLDAAETERVVHAALDSGITLFDTADVYGGTRSEEYLGRALKGRRDAAVIATKFGKPVDEHRKGGHPDYIRRAVEDSLRRLATDRIDLYQMHAPDPDVPIGDTLAALDDLVAAGKVREIGCSNFSLGQLEAAAAAARPGGARFASVQNEYSLVEREAEAAVLPYCERERIAFLPYFPLASGLLTGKYRLGEAPPAGTRLAEARWARGVLTEENLRRVEALVAYAESRGRTLLDLAFAWLLARPAVASVIAGATRPEQVRANAAAAAWRLTQEDRAGVDSVLGVA